MTKLEQKFHEELLMRCEQAQEQGECNLSRFMQNIEKFGGVKAAKDIMRRGRTSDGFDKLKEAGLLKLTMEATVIESKYGDLFTDEEVNNCYDILIEAGYY